MQLVINWLSAFVARLCQMFDVTAESITQDRRGNMPPPSGGISSF
jgi:hypothetical protein